MSDKRPNGMRSNAENILRATLGESVEYDNPNSPVEYYLVKLKEAIEPKQDTIKIVNKRVSLATLTWSASAQGMYYSNYFSIDGITNILAITLGGFQAWRPTDVFIPRISVDGTQMQILSNVSNFANLAYAEYRAIGV